MTRETLKKHMSYLVEVVSIQEVFGRHKELPKYDPEFYKQLICKPEIELPEIEFNIAYEQHKVHQAGTLLTNLKS